MPESPTDKARPHPWKRRDPGAHRAPAIDADAPYAELSVTTNYTFLTGASHPEEFIEHAASIGQRAVAITDTNTLGGIVRAQVASRDSGLPFIVGCRVALADPPGLSVLAYPTSRSAYARLCNLLTLGKRRAPKGECRLTLDDIIEHQDDLLAVLAPTAALPGDEAVAAWRRLAGVFDDDRLSLGLSRLYNHDDEQRLRRLSELAHHLKLPAVALNEAYYHAPERRPLQDVLTCIRHTCTIEEAGARLFANAERCLKPPHEMARLFADRPEAVRRTVEIAERARAFNLDELRYEYPVEPCPPGLTPMEHLTKLTWAGAARRYAAGVPDKVRNLLYGELALIDELHIEPYFLTCWDIVRFARSRAILCQGRGGAANSSVCFCLGITEVDPSRFNLLFARFVSRARAEPPDIDIDFEHERREEVIQYLYSKYGRERAALTAVIISYRTRSAIREVGKAMGLSLDAVDTMARNLDRWFEPLRDHRVREAGFNTEDPTIRMVLDLTRQLIGFPRHRSQHVGGFVITRSPLCDLVPIENAAMDDRTVIEWDKDDIDAMSMLKVDCLGLGMLTCLRKALVLLGARMEEESDGATGRRSDEGIDSFRAASASSRSTAPAHAGSGGVDSCPDSSGSGSLSVAPSLRRSVALDSLHLFDAYAAVAATNDAAVYGMIQRADTIGVFQIESRAQMSMLPRLRPKEFYDLVIEVAIVRPGPIQGKMVHPYLRRRNGEEPVTFPSPDVEGVLGRTLGVPLFQEQAMQLAIVAAGFTPDEADQLRRAMAAWRRKGDKMARFGEKLIAGMTDRGYPLEFAERCFEQIKGFSEYGFPESHAASFALLVYISAWLKHHEPAAFASALINSQPMGFYQPAQIVRDAQEHAVTVLPIDVNRSTWDCSLEASDGATERRSDEGEDQEEYADEDKEETACDDDQDIPGPDRVAESDEPCKGGVSGDRGHAAPGAIQPDYADAPGGDLGAIEHRRGPRAPEPHGLHPVPPHGTRFAGRTEHPDRAGDLARNAHPEPVRDDQPSPGDRPGSARPDPQPRSPEQADAVAAYPSAASDPGSPFVALSLRRSVALRLGMRLVKGLSEADADRVSGAVARRGGPFPSIDALWRASGVSVAGLRGLARADAFGSMGLDRRAALWAIRPLRDEELPLYDRPDLPSAAAEPPAALPVTPARVRVLHDYESHGLSLKAHPLSFIRGDLDQIGVTPTGELKDPVRCPTGRPIAVAGIVLIRQRPSTASGVVFITLEDETGIANLIIWPKVFERFRRAGRLATVLLARGRIERQGEVVHVHADILEDLDERLSSLAFDSRDFH